MAYDIPDRLSGNLLKPLLKKLSKRGEDVQLKRVLASHYEVEIADAMKILKPKHHKKVLGLLNHERAADVISHLDGEMAVARLESLSESELRPIMNQIDADDRTRLLASAGVQLAEKWLSLLSAAGRREAEDLLNYPEDSVGRLMTTQYLSIAPDATVQDTLNYIRRHGHEAETLHTLYVVDENGLLLGVVLGGPGCSAFS